MELALNVIPYGLYTRWMYKDTVISIWYSWYHIDSALIVVIVPVQSVLDQSEVMLLGNWEVDIVYEFSSTLVFTFFACIE